MQNVSVTIELEDVCIFDRNLVKHFQATEQGLKPEDLEKLSLLVPELISGQIDVVSITLADGVKAREQLNELLKAQFNAVFNAYIAHSRSPMPPIQANYAGLHVDAERSLDGNYLTDIEVRIHCNPGNHKAINCPPGRNPRDFDPYLLFGRLGKLEIYQETLAQSYETFKASAAINLMNPTWNIFRAHGRHYRGASNAPVPHAAIPRILANDILDPEASFTPLTSFDTQTVKVNGRTQLITPFPKSPFVDGDGNELGVTRTFELVNYPISNSGTSRSLVA